MTMTYYSMHPVRNPRFVFFRTRPLENLSHAVKLPINKRFLGNPTLEQILDSEILLCELGVMINVSVILSMIKSTLVVNCHCA